MLKLLTGKRIADDWGQGHFGASRGKRLHIGQDYVAYPGQRLLSPVAGKVTKLGYPYKDDLAYRYVEVTTDDRSRHRFFYVHPGVKINDSVEVGTVLGTVQNLGTRYKDITPHVHYEIIDSNGRAIDPENP